jgi:hypothetical protein
VGRLDSVAGILDSVAGIPDSVVGTPPALPQKACRYIPRCQCRSER